MWCIVSGSGSPSRYTPGGFWSRTAPRISTRSSPSRNARTRYSRSWSTSRPSGSGGRISSLANMCEHCYRPLRHIDDPGYRRRRWASRHRHPRCGAPRRARPARRRARRRAAGGGDGRPVQLRLHRGPRRRRPHGPLHRQPARQGRRRHRRAVRPAPRRRRPARRLHPLPRDPRGGGAGPSPTRSRSAARGWPPTPSARRSTPRPSCCCSTHAFDVWRVDRVAIATDARNERSRQAIERLGARFEGDPAPPPSVAGRRRGRPAAGHGAVLDHRRRLAGRRAGPAHPPRRPPA